MIVGGTGEWEGVSGRFSEVIHVTGMTAEGKRSSQLELRYIIEK